MRDEVPGRRRDRRLLAAGEEIHKTNELCVVLEVEIVLSASVYQRLRRENKNVETDLMECRKRSLPGGVPRASSLAKSCPTVSFQVCFEDWIRIRASG